MRKGKQILQLSQGRPASEWKNQTEVLSNEIIPVGCLAHSKPSEVYYAVNSDKERKNSSWSG